MQLTEYIIIGDIIPNNNVHFGNHVMDSFEFESGRVLKNVNVEYGCSGIPQYDEEGNITNAIVFFQTLKGGHSILNNYSQLTEKCDFDKDEYFFIKVSSLGAPDSCSPSSTGLNYNFPKYTFKDRINFTRQFLAEKFNIKRIFGIVGEGLGGFEVYTWACEYPDEMDFIIVLNSSFKTYGFRYVMVKAAEAIIDSSDEYYHDEYSIVKSKLLVAITRMMFAGYFSRSIFEELSVGELDSLMEDYVDEGLFMDIYDFKFRNDCILEFDVSDKLINIEAKALIMGMYDFIFFNPNTDVLPLKNLIKDSVIAVYSGKKYYDDDEDYTDIGYEIISFLNKFKEKKELS